MITQKWLTQIGLLKENRRNTEYFYSFKGKFIFIFSLIQSMLIVTPAFAEQQLYCYRDTLFNIAPVDHYSIDCSKNPYYTKDGGDCSPAVFSTDEIAKMQKLGDKYVMANSKNDGDGWVQDFSLWINRLTQAWHTTTWHHNPSSEVASQHSGWTDNMDGHCVLKAVDPKF